MSTPHPSRFARSLPLYGKESEYYCLQSLVLSSFSVIRSARSICNKNGTVNISYDAKSSHEKMQKSVFAHSRKIPLARVRFSPYGFGKRKVHFLQAWRRKFFAESAARFAYGKSFLPAL